MSVIVKCKSCNGTGYIPMGNGVRGLLVCKACNGVGKYENDEITIINDEYYYKIPNGTSYVYETIPKEFKPYFDKLQQENKQLKEMFEDSKTYGKQFSYKHNKNLLEANERLSRKNKQLKEENEELKLIVGLQQKRNLIRKFDEEYDEEDKKKNPNRTYARITPDAEVVYQRYYKQKEVIEEVRKLLKGCIEKYGVHNMNTKDFDELLQILEKAKENKQ